MEYDIETFCVQSCPMDSAYIYTKTQGKWGMISIEGLCILEIFGPDIYIKYLISS